MVFIILYLPIKIVCININSMKNDTSLKTMVLAIVLAMHGGLIAWAWKMQPQTETVNTENLTFVDLNALEVGSDGGDGAAAGAQGLAAAPPPKKETEPTTVAPPPPPTVPNRPAPPEQRVPPKKISRPKPQAVEEPKINTVERDDKPADIIQQPKTKAFEKPIEKPKSIEKIKPLEKPIEKIKPAEKPIEKIKPAEKPIEKPVEKPKPQIDEAKLAAERAERIAAEKAAAEKAAAEKAAAEKAAAEKAAAEKAAQNAARAAAEKAAREAAGNGNGNDSSSNNRSGSINGGKNGIAGGEGRTGNASNPKGKGVGDGDGDHSKGKNKGNGNGGDGNKPSSKGGIADGGVISRPAPEYPAASIENEEEGTVSIEIIVEANGSVSSARIAKSSGHNRLDNAALRAFKAGRYKPKSDDGTPIRTRFIVKTNFSLNE